MATFPYGQTQSQDDLINEVEYHADRQTPAGQSIGLAPERVYGNLVAAMRNVLNAAPRMALDRSASDGSGQSATNTNGYTVIALPDDFTRFMELRLASWEADVYQMQDPRAERVQRQYNEYTQADAYNPVVAKVPDPGGASGEGLRCWPQGASPTIDRFTYVAEVAPEDSTPELQKAIILLAAAYTLEADKEEGSEIMRQASRIILGQIQSGQAPVVSRAVSEAEGDS